MGETLKTILVSGGFDPLHIGHLHHLQAARALGDRLVVALNDDAWLIRKKNHYFMPETERAEILRGLACVDEVFILHGDRDDASEAILSIRPDVFAKGGDRDLDSLPIAEIDACRQVGAVIACGVGGGKIQSSSWLEEKARRIV